MGDGEASAQHGAVRSVEMEQRGRQALVEPAFDAALDVSAGPRCAEPFAFQVQIGDLIKRIDGAQAGVELQAVNDPDLGIEPNVLGPQVPVPVDDAVPESAHFQHAAMLGHEAALDAVHALDERGWKGEARIEQDPAVGR
jgi:hypothetical protein